MTSFFSCLSFQTSIIGLLSLFVCFSAQAKAGQACDKSTFIIGVDIGHTEVAPGAISARGVPEFKFNRVLAKEIVAALKSKGFAKAFIINSDGRIGSLTERTREAAVANADLFLSIHHDSVQPHYLESWTFNDQDAHYYDRFSGYSLFVSAKNPQFDRSRRIAIEIGKAFRERGLEPSLHHAEPIPGENRLLLNPNLGVYLFDDLVVLKSAEIPAVLIEAGIIVNRNDEVVLAGPERQQVIAAGITSAIGAFCQQVGTAAETKTGTPDADR